MFNGYRAIKRSNYNNERCRKKMTISMAVFDIAVLWYYSFGGSITLRPFASFFWIGMALLGWFVFDMNRIILNKYLGLCFVAIAYMLLTSLFSVSISVSLKYALSTLLYLIIAIEITSNYENIRYFLKVLFGYSIILLGITYIQKFNPELYLRVFATLLPQQYHEDVLEFMRRGSTNGFFNQTSSNATAMSLGTGVCLYRLLKKRPEKRFSQSVDFLLLLAFLYGVVLTVRRGALLAVALILAYILYTDKKSWGLKVLFVALGLWLLVLGGINYIPALSNILDKNAQNVLAGDISNGRFDIWADCFALFLQKPLLGYGVDSFNTLLNYTSVAHNSYIQVFVEQGIIGFVLFFAPFVYEFRMTYKYKKNCWLFSREEKAIVTFALFWQLYCFISAIFESTFTAEITVFMLFIVQFIIIKMLEYRTYGNGDFSVYAK